MGMLDMMSLLNDPKTGKAMADSMNALGRLPELIQKIEEMNGKLDLLIYQTSPERHIL